MLFSPKDKKISRVGHGRIDVNSRNVDGNRFYFWMKDETNSRVDLLSKMDELTEDNVM